MYIESRSTDRYQNLKAGHQSIVEETEQIFSRQPYLKEDIASLTSKLSSLETDLSKLRLEEGLSELEADEKRKELLEAECQRLSRKNETELQNHSRALNNVFARLNNEASAIISQFQRLKPAMDCDLIPRRRILQSLYFAKMNDRRDHVRRAHGDTYRWMFKSKGDSGNSPAIWDDFVQWLCREGGSNCYWVSGKPGSGKTTLMRELDERFTEEISSNFRDISQNDTLQTALQEWVGKGYLLKGCCYFWYAGTADQRSLTGLLQSLVRHLLEQRPDLVDKVVNVERWDTAVGSEFHQLPWEEKELLGVLERIVDQTKHEDKILLFVDGLDEYEGSDERRNELLDIIKRLTDSTHVKACVASRPWNIFRDAFEHCAKLRLEDLTKEDMRTFVCEKLEADKLFQRLKRRDVTLLERISSEINDKAQGVFLWVYLVVRDLLKVVRDGGCSDDLFLELEQIPSDLDEYFERMLQTIEPRHRMEAAQILQTALCSMDFVANNTQYLVSSPDLCVLHLEYIRKATDPCFAAKDQIYMFNRHEEDTGNDWLLESLDRRLNSRCMGLLEANNRSWIFFAPVTVRQQGVWCRKVEFLHGTVKDFLQRPQTQKRLESLLSKPFDAHLFRCNLLVTNVSNSTLAITPEARLDTFSCFFWHITSRRDPENAEFALFELMAKLLVQQAAELRNEHGNDVMLPYKTYNILSESILYCDRECDTAMSLAIKLRWTPYIQSKLTNRLIQEKTGRPLLDYALRPCYYPLGEPCLWTVQKLLEMGADPCAPIENERGLPVWVAFILSTVLSNSSERTAVINAVTILIKHGAWNRVSASDLTLNLRHLRHTAGFEGASGPFHQAYLETLYSLLHLFDGQTLSMKNARYRGSYLLIEMLKKLGRWRGLNGDKEPFFTEQEIVHFETLQRKRDEAEVAKKRQREEHSDFDVSDTTSSEERDSKRRRTG